MRLTVVGCSGSYPGPDGPASCYLVQSEHQGRTWRILLDLGSGALGPLHRYVDPLAIDAVLLSHLHPDHCFDISGYYVLRKYHPTGPPPRIPVYGPKGTAQRMARAYGLSEGPGMTEQFDFQDIDQAPLRIGPFVVTVAEVVHPVDAYAIKVEDGSAALVYSGDTAPATSLVDLAKGADLLLAEASFRVGEDNPIGLHLTGRQAAEAATLAGAGRLVLTHIPPWHNPESAYDEARPAYDGLLDLARPGATYEL